MYLNYHVYKSQFRYLRNVNFFYIIKKDSELNIRILNIHKIFMNCFTFIVSLITNCSLNLKSISLLTLFLITFFETLYTASKFLITSTRCLCADLVFSKRK